MSLVSFMVNICSILVKLSPNNILINTFRIIFSTQMKYRRRRNSSKNVLKYKKIEPANVQNIYYFETAFFF